ncbi:GTPase ObgE [Candidatus Gracilibacteria bacterium]|nr:GTPase ObgE [Candidatus Gracilibacteria bacterium]
MFLDEHKIKLIAGKGGDGCSSFRREKFVARGGPNGGDGGTGGDIIIATTPHHNTLSHLAYKKTFEGGRGGHGLGKDTHGANGDDLIIEVPVGTLIWNEEKTKVIADLAERGERIIMVRGGIGGMGNARFKTSTNQAPRFAETGEPGGQLEIILELKLVADVGIIGFPSAGKSTLISVISNAKPKIAEYHFTTLAPNLGVVKYHSHNFVVADIPGLIEGASEGKGLGHKFLKHVARTKILVHVIDCALEDPDKLYQMINSELKKFDKRLSKLPQIIVLNKIDLFDKETLAVRIKELQKVTKKAKIFPISAVAHKGLKELLAEMSQQLTKLTIKEAKEDAEEKVIKIVPILRPHEDKVKFNINETVQDEEKQLFYVSGKRLEQITIMTDLKNREGLERIYRYIEAIGLQQALKKRKAKLGDKIRVNEKSIPFRPGKSSSASATLEPNTKKPVTTSVLLLSANSPKKSKKNAAKQSTPKKNTNQSSAKAHSKANKSSSPSQQP